MGNERGGIHCIVLFAMGLLFNVSFTVKVSLEEGLAKPKHAISLKLSHQFLMQHPELVSGAEIT